MGFLSVIRRWALRDKMPIREISRRTGLSRNTIRKYLREGAVEPRFKTPVRPSKLDPYADRLSAWLLAQTRKPRKERRTVKRMHEDLVKLGYDGSYGRVAAFARAWREDRLRAEQTAGRGTFIPGVPARRAYRLIGRRLGSIGGERVKLGGTRAVARRAASGEGLSAPNARDVVRRALARLRVFEGVPGRGIYDNMKTAVDRVGR